MPHYLVRANCEYSLMVEADSPDQAMEVAAETPLGDWDEAWSQYEAEECDVTSGAELQGRRTDEDP